MNTAKKVKIQIDLAANPTAAKKLEAAFRRLGFSGKKSGHETARSWKGADSQLERSTELAGKLKGALLGIGIGMGVRAVVAAVAAQEQSLAQLSASMKSTGNAAGLTRQKYIALGNAIQKNTIYSNDAAVGIEALLLTFKQIRGPQFRETLGLIADMSAKLGTDLQTNALQAGKAINDPIYGIAELTRVGVTFTDKQKAVVKALVETGHAAKAQEVIIGELRSEFGGSAAAAADTFSGALKQLGNAASDLIKGNGVGGIDGAKTSLQELTKELEDPRIKAGFASLVQGLLTVIGVLATATSKLSAFAANVGTFFAKQVSGMSNLNDKVAVAKKYLKEYSDQLRIVQYQRTHFFGGYGRRIAEGGDLIQGKWAWDKGKTDQSFKAYEKFLLMHVKLARMSLQHALAESNKKPIQVATPPIVLKKSKPTTAGDTKAEIAKKLQAALKLHTAWAALAAQVRGLDNSIAGPGARAWSVYAASVYRAAEAARHVVAAGGNAAQAQEQVRRAKQAAEQIRDKALVAATVARGSAQKQVIAWIKQTSAELAGPAAVALEQYKTKVAALRKLMDAGNLTQPVFERAVAVATNRLLSATKSTTKQVSQYWVEAARSSQDALAQFLFDPFREGLRGMLMELANTLRQMLAQMLAHQLIKSLLSFGMSQGGSIAQFAALFASERGSVFSSGMPTPFAGGGVIGSPTLFPMRRGVGLMGEAGPEAIMPLLRSPTGHLGVRAQTSNLGIRVVNVVDSAAIANAMSGSEGERVILNIIRTNSRSIRQEIG